MIVTLLLLGLTMYHCMQSVIYRLAYLILFESLFHVVTGSVMILLIITTRTREKLGHFKKTTHTFSILEYTHFIGVWYVIIGIYCVFIQHTATVLHVCITSMNHRV